MRYTVKRNFYIIKISVANERKDSQKILTLTYRLKRLPN